MKRKRGKSRRGKEEWAEVWRDGKGERENEGMIEGMAGWNNGQKRRKEDAKQQ